MINFYINTSRRKSDRTRDIASKNCVLERPKCENVDGIQLDQNSVRGGFLYTVIYTDCRMLNVPKFRFVDGYKRFGGKYCLPHQMVLEFPHKLRNLSTT